MPQITALRMESPIQRNWPIQRFHSTLPANRSADIGCKEPGGGFFKLPFVEYSISGSFNAEAKGAQMLYRLTFNSRFRCLKLVAVARQRPRQRYEDPQQCAFPAAQQPPAWAPA